MQLSTVEKAPHFFTFVCTDLSGQRLYGGTLHFFELQSRQDTELLLGGGKEARELAVKAAWDVVYAPRAITVISHYPLFNLFREFLGQIYHISLSSAPVPLERFVSNLVAETPLPPRGLTEVAYVCAGATPRVLSISRPPKNQLPMVDVSFRPMFGMLGVENIMVIFQSLLMERQIIVYSSNVSIVTPVLEAFLSLLYPMVWQGAYIPVLPWHMMEFIDAPIPYVIGVHRKIVDTLPKEKRPTGVLFVDLDADDVTVRSDLTVAAGTEQLPPMPDKETGKLWQKLLDFGGLCHRSPATVAALNAAGNLFPKSEHLVPIATFPNDGASVEMDDGVDRHFKAWRFSLGWDEETGSRGSIAHCAANGRGGGSRRSATSETKATLQRISVVTTHSTSPASVQPSILDPNNNCETGDGFDAREIRSAFLRFFVAMLGDFEQYLLAQSEAPGGDIHGGGHENGRRPSSLRLLVVGFDKTAFIRDHGVGYEAFFTELMGTQMWDKFITDAVHHPDADSVSHFRESILAKRNRSKFNKKVPTPFLDSGEWDVCETFNPPVPDTNGLPRDKRYVYHRFPDMNLSSSTLGTPRNAREISSGQSERVHRGRYDAGSAMLAMKTSPRTRPKARAASLNPLDVNFGSLNLTAPSSRSPSLSVDDGPGQDMAPSPKTRGDVSIRAQLFAAKQILQIVQRGVTLIAAQYRMRRERRSYLNRQGHLSVQQIALRFMSTENAAAMRLQRHFKRVLQRRAHAAVRIQSVLRARLGRHEVCTRRLEWREGLRRVLWYLWEMDGTPLVVRSYVWKLPHLSFSHLLPDPPAVQLLVLEHEIIRVASALKVDIFAMCGIYPKMRLLQHCTPQVAEEMRKIWTSRGLGQAHLDVTVKKRLQIERGLLYDALKRRIDGVQKDALYACFGLDGSKKRKQRLSQRLWTSFDLADASAAVVCDMAHSIRYPPGDSFAVHLSAGGQVGAQYFVQVEHQALLLGCVVAVVKGLLDKKAEKS